MAMVHHQARGQIISDGDGYGPYALGGQVNVKSGSFLFSDATKALFTLPEGAEIVGWETVIETAFDAGTTNELDLGDGTTVDRFADGLALGSAGFVKAGFKPVEMFTPLAADTTFVAAYNQSGTAATAGKATVVCYWILR